MLLDFEYHYLGLSRLLLKINWPIYKRTISLKFRIVKLSNGAEFVTCKLSLSTTHVFLIKHLDNNGCYVILYNKSFIRG